VSTQRGLLKIHSVTVAKHSQLAEPTTSMLAGIIWVLTVDLLHGKIWKCTDGAIMAETSQLGLTFPSIIS